MPLCRNTNDSYPAVGIEKGLSGLVVFIQRFGSAANLNIHFHVIALDGVYEKKSTGCLKFYAAQAASVAHRIAFGPNAGQPVRRLKTQTSLWPLEQNFKSSITACITAGGSGFSYFPGIEKFMLLAIATGACRDTLNTHEACR